MISGRVARRVRVTTRNKLPLLPSSLFHRRTWRALAVLAVLTTNPFPFPFQAATTTTTRTTVRAFATGTSFPNRNRKQHERTSMPSNHQHQHKYQDSPTAHSLASGRLESPSAENGIAQQGTDLGGLVVPDPFPPGNQSERRAASSTATAAAAVEDLGNRRRGRGAHGIHGFSDPPRKHKDICQW